MAVGCVFRGSDYYPFGMQMPGRKYSVGSEYRYGFNGKENDNDISEGGQDYGMRIYNVKLGRFLSVDPVTNKYPNLSPYQFASNRPVDGIDLDGLEWYKKTYIFSFPIYLASEKEVRNAFISRAYEYVHSIKSLPKVVDEYLKTCTTSLPGNAYVSQQEIKRKNIEIAMAEGGQAYAKELFQLTLESLKGNKSAQGALAFESMVLLIPDVEVALAFSRVGRIGKLLTAETRASIKSLGRFEGGLKEFAVETKMGSRAEAIQIAEQITGEVPDFATPIKVKQGILTDKLVGYQWKDESGVFNLIRLDHDPKIGTHINITKGKDKIAIKVNLSENQTIQLGTNEIMKTLKKGK